ncbi:amino acid ABC transporter substrate-binding protein [Pyrofollis japonicus]|uniref:amino acid ABC transporter substrate-binding protein n=1 Tax=Pyrofollis japonicus TaxID=3060460 RepID=UPI00295BB102|nr:amino acid ABC transporter substrate-binding protein [Pyrofollis japonicus]BEP17973.1 amino acid ABC transporter substrate-binding protein [Pyrofollis japonicus]
MASRTGLIITSIIIILVIIGAAYYLAKGGGKGTTTTSSAPATSTPSPTTSTPPATTTSGAGGAGGECIVKIGFTASLTGKLQKESAEQLNGIKLWEEQVNSKGGVKLPDGRVCKIKLVYYDDESKSARVQELYQKLITSDKVDYLISPYSSGLTAAAAAVTDSYHKIMIATGAASDSIFTKGYQYVYQLYTPASRYMTPTVDLLMKLDPNNKKVALLFENSKFAKSVAAATKKYLEEKGFQIVYEDYYPPGTTEFSTYIAKIASSGATAVFGGGHFQDGFNLVKQLYDAKIKGLKYVAILVAPPEPAFAELGDAAVGVIGPSQWEPGVKYSPDAAKKLGIEWYGPTVEEFVKAYEAKYGHTPGYHAAGGYAAGLLIQYILEHAGLDTEKAKQLLDNLDLMTFWGHIKFDNTPEKHGLQIGHSMVLVQWQKQGGKLVKVIVYPEEAAEAEPVYPLPWGS